MTAPNGRATATVETLAAEVHVLKVGSRQITMSVYEQLDKVGSDEIEPFGRVRPKGATWQTVYVVGRSLRTADSGALVRSWHDSSLQLERLRDAEAGRTSHPIPRSWYDASSEERAALEQRAAEWAALPLIVLAGLR